MTPSPYHLTTSPPHHLTTSPPHQVGVLDAVGLRDGPGHTEVKMTKRASPRARGAPESEAEAETETESGSESESESESEPCLIEVNARWHACHFRPVVDACLGYNAIEASALSAISRAPTKGE